MSGLRSVTLGTNDLSKTKELFNHIIGLQHSTKNEHAIRFGDANLSPERVFTLLRFQRKIIKIHT